MIIAQISDTHLLSLNEKDPLERERAVKRAENLERTVRALNELHPAPLAIVHTGDMVNYDTNNGYGLAHEILSQLKAPFLPTVGNRDYREDLIGHFLAPDRLPITADFCQYRAVFDEVDLIAVDTKSDTRRIGTSCERRLNQLEILLDEDREKPVFLFLHHPPVPVESLKNPLQFESLDHARGFSDLFDRYDNIARILCGHTHRSDVITLGRHTASTLPSLATDIRLDNYPPHLSEEPVFQTHELHDDACVTSMSRFVLTLVDEAV